MPASVPFRADFDARHLRRLASRCKDARQSRRLLSLAAAYGRSGLVAEKFRSPISFRPPVARSGAGFSRRGLSAVCGDCRSR